MVLTRLPVGRSLDAAPAADGLAAFAPDGEAATAEHRLMTLDRRARATYERLGTPYELLLGS